MNLSWQFKHFNELSLVEFHDLVALRLQAFVVEQDCKYVDLDGKDKKSYHMICRDGFGDIVATARIMPANISYPEVSLGRVVVHDNIRRNHIGTELMERCMEFIKAEFGDVSVRIAAQKYLVEFYEKLGFIVDSDEFLDAGIPHKEMIYTPKN